jgi:ABC-type maltose transport system permease subunit
MFTVAKCIRILPKECSISIRRLYRLEFWAGVCFLIATFFWFYNEYKMSALPLKGALSILHDTILFAMSGAVVQLIASWMIYFREKKEITNPGA